LIKLTQLIESSTGFVKAQPVQGYQIGEIITYCLQSDYLTKVVLKETESTLLYSSVIHLALELDSIKFHASAILLLKKLENCKLNLQEKRQIPLFLARLYTNPTLQVRKDLPRIL